MQKYSPTEIIQLAIRIEENGRLFYQELAQRYASESLVGELFADLAEQEGDHRHYFEELARKVVQEDAAYPLSEDYFEYLRGFADHVIFTQAEVKQAVKEIADLDHALTFCMQRELDAVQYYEKLMGMLPAEEQIVVELIVVEEKRHYHLLREQHKQIALNQDDR